VSWTFLQCSFFAVSPTFAQVTYHVLPWILEDVTSALVVASFDSTRPGDFTSESCRSLWSFTRLRNFQVAQFSRTSHIRLTFLPICGVRCSEASWETFVWPAQDADQSWTLCWISGRKHAHFGEPRFHYTPHFCPCSNCSGGRGLSFQRPWHHRISTVPSQSTKLLVPIIIITSHILRHH
jgi:hypothetical protein